MILASHMEAAAVCTRSSAETKKMQAVRLPATVVAVYGKRQSVARADAQSLAQQLGARASGSDFVGAELAAIGSKAKKIANRGIKVINENSELNVWLQKIRLMESIIC